MEKSSKPSYVVEFELQVTKHQIKHLEKKMHVAKQIYNACLGEALKRLRALVADPIYRLAVSEIQHLKAKILTIKSKSTSKRNENERIHLRNYDDISNYIKQLELYWQYSEYQLHAWVVEVKHHFEGVLGIDEVQKLATRAFKAVEKVHYHQAKKVSFKRKDDDMSIEGKSAKSTLKRKGDWIAFGKGFNIPIIIKNGDSYAQEALSDRTKYVRLIKREIRGKQRYFTQFVQEGFPPIKRKKNSGMTKNPHDITGKWVGLDAGTSTIAIASNDSVQLRELAPECVQDAKELRRIERAMDRSKRAFNPQNFNDNGVAKRGVKWKYTKHYLKLKAKRKNCHRKTANNRKQSHEKLANAILSLGCDVYVETMNMRGLQKRAKKTTRNTKNGKINTKKRYGKVIANRAPAMLITIIDRKLGYQGKSIKKINTAIVKASQFNHITGEYHKKDLSQRWNEDILGYSIQRDMYSAFLIGCTTGILNEVDVTLCEDRWLNFLEKHNQEVERLRNSTNKTLSWYVKPDKKKNAALVI